MLIDHLFVSHHNLTLDNSEFKVSLASQKIILVSSAKIRKSTFLRRVNYVIHIYISPQTYTQIHTRNVVQWKGGGGGCGWNPSPKFFICCSISKRFYPWKAFDLFDLLTYDVISRNHSNCSIATVHHWTCLKMCANWTRQVLMFYPQGRNSKKPYGRGEVASIPPPLYVRGLRIARGQENFLDEFCTLKFPLWSCFRL